MNIYAIGIELPQHTADDKYTCLFKLCYGDWQSKIYWEHVETYNDEEVLKDIDIVCGLFIKRGHTDRYPFEESHFMDKDKIVGHIRSSS